MTIRIKITLIFILGIILGAFLLSELIISEQAVNSNPATPQKTLGSVIGSSRENTVEEQHSIKAEEMQKLKVSDIATCQKTLDLDSLINSDSLDNTTKMLFKNNELLQAALESNNHIDSQHALVLTAKLPENKKRLEVLLELSETYPDNKLLSYDLINYCTRDVALCENEVLDKAVVLDGENGAVWLAIATNAIAKHDDDYAIYALNQLASVSIYKEFTEEHLTMFESALSLAGASQGLSVDIAAFGFVASLP